MIPFIFKDKKTQHSYKLPVKKYMYGILIMDSAEEVETNPQLVVIEDTQSYLDSFHLFSSKEKAIERLEEMRKYYPSATYRLIRYTLLSN